MSRTAMTPGMYMVKDLPYSVMCHYYVGLLGFRPSGSTEVT